MTTTDTVMKSIEGFTPDEISAKFIDAIYDGRAIRRASSRFTDEFPEDAFIDLLKMQDLSRETRLPIIQECHNTYAEVLATFFPNLQLYGNLEAYVRFFRLVDLAQPVELEKDARLSLAIVVNHFQADRPLNGPIVRAALKYHLTQSDIPLWEKALNEASICAYAFNALIKIDPNSDKVDEYLEILREKQQNCGVDINIEYLELRLKRERERV